MMIRLPLYGSSPHTRGALLLLHVGGPGERIIPAYAGSTTGICRHPRRVPDHPRIRGEHGVAGGHAVHETGSSPHTRGALSTPVMVVHMTWDHPRIRGEHGARWTPSLDQPGSSPHTRGARGLCGPGDRGAGIIPAYAGSTARSPAPSCRGRDHPRIRGEHRMLSPGGVFSAGSSPHTRGAPGRGVGVADPGGIIPAYAGSTTPSWKVTGKPADHPRIRGEHRPTPKNWSRSIGSSPHTRGAPSGGKEETECITDHPRIRGEHFGGSTKDAVDAGSSPHTRGARRLHGRNLRVERIIPAYAGSTRPDPRQRDRGEDHPRIRGEHMDGAVSFI